MDTLLANIEVYKPNKKVITLFKKAFKSHPNIFSTFNCLKSRDKDSIIKILLNVVTLRVNKKSRKQSKKTTKLTKLKGGGGRKKKLRKRRKTIKQNERSNNNSDYNPNENSNVSNNSPSNSFFQSVKKSVSRLSRGNKGNRRTRYIPSVSRFLGKSPGLYNSTTSRPGWNHHQKKFRSKITNPDVYGVIREGFQNGYSEQSSNNTIYNSDRYASTNHENKIVENYINKVQAKSRKTTHSACELQAGLQMLDNMGVVGPNIIAYIKGHTALPLEKGALGLTHKFVPEGDIDLNKIYGGMAEDIQNISSSESEEEEKENNEQRSKDIKFLLKSMAALLMSIMVMYFLFNK